MFALHRLCPIPRARSRYVTLVQTVPPIIDTITTGRRFVFRLPKILLCSLFVISTGRGTNVSFARSRGQASIDNVDNEAANESRREMRTNRLGERNGRKNGATAKRVHGAIAGIVEEGLKQRETRTRLVSRIT